MESAVLAIVNTSVCLNVRLAVCPSVTRWHCQNDWCSQNLVVAKRILMHF